MDKVNFDPIVYLKLDIPEEKKESVRDWLYQEMANFILEKYILEVDSNKLDLLNKKIKENTKAENLYGIITGIDENFETKKLKYLEEFEQNINQEKLKELL